jgi:hypothetical protein
MVRCAFFTLLTVLLIFFVVSCKSTPAKPEPKEKAPAAALKSMGKPALDLLKEALENEKDKKVKKKLEAIILESIISKNPLDSLKKAAEKEKDEKTKKKLEEIIEKSIK